MITGTTSMKTAKATSKKARAISSQKADEEPLASEINVVSTAKGKNPKQPRGKKKGTNKKKKQEDSTLEKYFVNPTGRKKPNQPCFICDEDHYTRECPH